MKVSANFNSELLQSVAFTDRQVLLGSIHTDPQIAEVNIETQPSPTSPSAEEAPKIKGQPLLDFLDIDPLKIGRAIFKHFK